MMILGEERMHELAKSSRRMAAALMAEASGAVGEEEAYDDDAYEERGVDALTEEDLGIIYSRENLNLFLQNRDVNENRGDLLVHLFPHNYLRHLCHHHHHHHHHHRQLPFKHSFYPRT
jgi:hypothetical protein